MHTMSSSIRSFVYFATAFPVNSVVLDNLFRFLKLLIMPVIMADNCAWMFI